MDHGNRRPRLRCQQPDAAIPCDVLLEAVTDDLPDHVCAEVAWASIREYAFNVTAGATDRFDRFWWPLGSRPEPGSILPWASFLLPGGLPIGLIVRRDLDGGTIFLLGHVLPADTEFAKGGISLPTNALLPPLWTFVQPSVITSWRQVASPPELKRLDRAERDLRNWYQVHLVGRRSGSPRGRRPDSEGDLAVFDADLRDSIRDLYRRRVRVTQADVAADMNITERQIRRRLAQLGTDWRSVVNEVASGGSARSRAN